MGIYGARQIAAQQVEEAQTLTDTEISAFCLEHNEVFRPYLERLRERDLRRGDRRVVGPEPGDLAPYPAAWRRKSGTTTFRNGQYVRYFDPRMVEPGAPVHRVSHGEIARMVVKDAIGGESLGAHDRQPPSGPPFLFDPKPGEKRHGYFADVDIKACFAQLLSGLPGPLLVYDSDTRNFIPNPSKQWDKDIVANKHIGRAIAGTFWHKEMCVFNYGRVKIVPNSRLYAPHIISWLMDVCQGIAMDAVDHFNCIRWHTDGGFIPMSNGDNLAFMKHLAHQWGLSSTVKRQGRMAIAGLNQFYISGDHSTPGFTKANRKIERISSLRHDLDRGFIRGTVTGEAWLTEKKSKPDPISHHEQLSMM